VNSTSFEYVNHLYNLFPERVHSSSIKLILTICKVNYLYNKMNLVFLVVFDFYMIAS